MTQQDQASICPLCGGSNQCGNLKVEESVTDCWCMTEEITPSALEKVPASLRGLSCICRACAHRYRDDSRRSSRDGMEKSRDNGSSVVIHDPSVPMK